MFHIHRILLCGVFLGAAGLHATAADDDFPSPLFTATQTDLGLSVVYARVRTFGWLHPAAKTRGNRVRALLGAAPYLSAAEQKTWDPPQISPRVEPEPRNEPTVSVQQTRPAATARGGASAGAPACGGNNGGGSKAPLCPHCQTPLRLLGVWRAGRPPPTGTVERTKHPRTAAWP